MGILDIIFPKFCINCKKYGEYLCSNCFTYLSMDVANICAVCSRPSIGGETHPGCKTKYSIDGTFVGIDYNNVAKKLIYQFKYRPYLSDLNKFLSDILYEALIQKEEFEGVLKNNPPVGLGLKTRSEGEASFVLVPIPLFPKKERKRGYNQSELLAKNLSKKLGLKSDSLLRRVRDTKIQAGLTKVERRENMKDAFTLKFDEQKIPENIFLVDDILTTGATFDSAAHVLKKNGAKKVYGIALAKEK